MIKLRDYQIECLNEICKQDPGNYLIQLPTGMGKTVIFTDYINNISGKALIISHREELVKQPLKYLNKSYSIEMAKNKGDLNSDVVSTCISSMVRRYKKYSPQHFDVIIWDEAHHTAAESYKKIFKYFKPRLNLGFTATPNRNDKAKLSSIFSKIIFKYDLLKAIKNNYLSDIRCKRVYVKLDLSKVKSSRGDYKIDDLEKELISSENGKSIGEIYKKHAVGATLIFAASVKHCEEIAKYINNSCEVITAKTKNRAEIIKKFTEGKIKCLVNCMIFTEGTDLPLINTIIMARPTKNESLYTQMVGRGLRLHNQKDKLNLIDCVGVSNDLSLITAPSLLGIDLVSNNKSTKKKDCEVDWDIDLFDLPELIEKREDIPENWKINYKLVNLWAKKKNYQLHGVNWYKHPDGHLTLQIRDKLIVTSPIDEAGNLEFKNKTYEAQNFFDRTLNTLNKKFKQDRYIWDLNVMKNWGYDPASQNQKNLIKRKLPDYKLDPKMNKLQANQILNKIFSK